MVKNLIVITGKHFAWMIANKAFSVIAFILLARFLGPKEFGNFIFFITILSSVSILGTFGLNQWYQKKIAEDEISTSVALNRIIGARLLTWAFILVLLALWLWGFPSFNSNFIVMLLLAASFPESMLATLDGYWLSQKKSGFVIYHQLLKSVFLVLSIGIFQAKITTSEAVAAYTIASYIGFLAYFLIIRKFDLRNINIQLAHSITALKESMKYALLVTTSFAYARGDQLLIRYQVSELALGIYGVAYRYLDAISMLPSALAQNLFHISAKKNTFSAKHLLQITFMMLILGVMTSSILWFATNLLTVQLLGSSYSDVEQIFQIFLLVIILFFVNSPLSTVVQSSQHVKQFLPWGVANTFLNIVLNIILLPIYGIQAAAWLMVATETTGLIINIYFCRRIYRK